MTLRNAVPTIVAESADALAEYAAISIVFDTAERLDVRRAAEGEMHASALTTPIRKGYDAYRDNHPLDWPTRFDTKRWTFLAAYRSGMRVGGAIVIVGDPSVELLESRRDLALLWDLRVAQDARGCGVGSALVHVAKCSAWANACSEIRVETQDVNVTACRLYARHAFRLHGVHKNAYPELPDETQLIWSADLSGMAD